jgi:flagellar hook-associated protein 1 FlgK
MSLTSAMQTGRSALAASQLGIQVAGNNMANAATPGYSRQVMNLAPMRGDSSGLGASVGRGVAVSAVNRQVDQALQARVMLSTSQQAAAQTRSDVLAQIESILGELGDNDLSSQLSAFFNSWSERANQTRSEAAVVQQGEQLATFMRRVRSELSDQRRQIDDTMRAGVGRANELLQTIAQLNTQIASTEGVGSPANPLRDQRDQAVELLSELIDVTVIDRGMGGVDLLVGSLPVLQGGRVRQLSLQQRETTDGTRISLAAGTPPETITPTSGRLGSLLQERSATADKAIADLDTLASSLIFEINRIHSTSSNAAGLASASSGMAIRTADRTLAFTDGANQTFANLPFRPVSGGFEVTVTHSATGATTTVRVPVDLDGINNTGLPGSADDTSPESLRAALDGIDGLNAQFGPDGKLRISAAEGYNFRFSNDSSGVLAVMGVNAYFAGSNAGDIRVDDALVRQPSNLAAGRIVNGQHVENAGAMGIAALATTGLASIGGRSLQGAWQETVQAVGGAASSARSTAMAKGMVRESLEMQRSSLSGVNIDEESINLLDYQRQYQAAARVISTVDQLTQVLLSMV